MNKKTAFFKAFYTGRINLPVFLLFLLPLYCLADTYPSYNLKVQIDPVKSRVSGKEVIKFEIPFSTDTIPFIFYHKGNIGNLIKNISVNGRQAALTPLTQNDITGFYITGFGKITGDKKQEISFEFESDSIDYSDGYFAAQQEWMPLMPFSDSTGFKIAQAGLKDFNISVSFPVQYVPVTTGIITSRNQAGNQVTLSSSIKQVTYYGICLSDKFKVDEVEADGLKIYSYYFEDDAVWGKKLLAMAKNAVNFYKKHFGFYPADQLSILPGGSHPNGGFPISSNMYVIHRGLDEKGAAAENFAQWITAHEIGHFYWGFGNVLFDQNYSIWFQISMGIYADWLFSEYAHLDKSVYDFDKRYMAGVINNFNTTIMQPVKELEKVSFDYNNVIDHGKSFIVLMMLKDLMGTTNFEAVYLYLLKNYKGKLVSLNQFESLCEKQSGLNLNWFFNAWYKSNGYVDYNISHVNIKIVDSLNTQVTCTIERRGAAYMPLDVVVETLDGQNAAKTIDGNFRDTIAVALNVHGVIKNIRLDPDHKIPLLSRYRQDTATIFQSVVYALGAKNYSQYFPLLNMIQGIATSNSYYNFLCGQLAWQTGNFKLAIEKLTNGVNANSGYYSERSLLELGKVYDLSNDRKRALDAYKKEIANGKDRRSVSLSKKYLGTPFTN